MKIHNDRIEKQSRRGHWKRKYKNHRVYMKDIGRFEKSDCGKSYKVEVDERHTMRVSNEVWA